MTKETKNKLNATKVEIDGMTFHSKFEGETYEALKNIEQSGLIVGLTTQHNITLIPAFRFGLDSRAVRATKMIVDFRFKLKMPDGREMVVDFETKGYQTDVYRIKIKLHKFMIKDLVKESAYEYILYRGRYLDSVYEQEMKIREKLQKVIDKHMKV